MFDIAWSEFLLIGAVALVVIGPKDLPKALRTVGRPTSSRPPPERSSPTASTPRPCAAYSSAGVRLM